MMAAAIDFSFNGIDVNLNRNLVNRDNFDQKKDTHYYSGYFWYEPTITNPLSKFLSIPKGFKEYIVEEVHIPYPPEFFIRILDSKKALDTNNDYLNTFLGNYLNVKDKIFNEMSKTDPGIIYMRKEFKKLRQRWETDIVESLRIAYTEYKLRRYTENNKNDEEKKEKDEEEEKKEKDEEEEKNLDFRTQEFRDFGQNLLKPDEIWKDFIEILRDNKIYRKATATTSPVTSPGTSEETNKDKFNNIFKINKDNDHNNDHFYFDKNFIGHQFKLLNIRYLWKYAKRVLETTNVIGDNSPDAYLLEWKKLMGYSDSNPNDDNNRVGDIIKNFLDYNKDLIRKDDCIQEELISTYKDAIATTYWNDKDDAGNIQDWRSPIIWIIVVLISYRIINVFFSMIKKDETGTSGFVYKVKDMGMFGGINDIFKYGNNGKITIHTPYSVLSPYWSFIRNREWFKEKLIQGYTDEHKVINSKGKDGPYVPHGMGHNPGLPLHDSIYLKSADKKEELTRKKLFQYMSCITIGFWFSLLENKLSESLRNYISEYGKKEWLEKALSIFIIFIAPVFGFLATVLVGTLGPAILSIGSIFLLVGYIVYFIVSIKKLYKNNDVKKKKLWIGIVSMFICLIFGIVSYYYFIKNLNDFNKIKIIPAIGCIFSTIIFLILGITTRKEIITERDFDISHDGLDTLFSIPILDDYIKLNIPDNVELFKRIESMTWFKKMGLKVFAIFVMTSGLIWAIIKMLPLSLYVFLWSSPKMKGEPGRDYVSKLLNIYGVGALIVIFGLLVWIVHNVYITNRDEGNIYVKRNAIISAMPHMAHKIQRFKYDALFTGFKRKMTFDEYRKKYEDLRLYYENDMTWEIEDIDDSISYTEMNNMHTKTDRSDEEEKEWKIIAPKFYQIREQIEQFKKKENMKNKDFIGCLDDDNYKYRAPPLGVIGIVMFVFAAQMAMSHITLPEVPKMPNFGDSSGASGDSDSSGDSEDSKRSGKSNHRIFRILFIFLITVCVLIIWSIEFVPSLLIMMDKKDGKTEYDVNNWMLIPLIGIVLIIGILIIVYMRKH